MSYCMFTSALMSSTEPVVYPVVRPTLWTFIPSVASMGKVVASLPTFGRSVGSAETALSIAAIAQSTLLFPFGERGTVFDRIATWSVVWFPLSRRAGWKIAVPAGSLSSLASTWLLLRMYRAPPLFTIAPKVPASTMVPIGGGPIDVPGLIGRNRSRGVVGAGGIVKARNRPVSTTSVGTPRIATGTCCGWGICALGNFLFT